MLISPSQQAIAKAWAGADAKGVVLVGRNRGNLETAASALGVPTLVAAGNVSNEDDIKSIFTKAVEKFGTVDVVINAAGAMDTDTSIGKIEPAKWWNDFVSIA